MSLFAFICPTCSKDFKRKGDLTRHMHLHTGDRRYKCELCDKAFSQFSGLKTHRNVHSKVKPFKCGIADCKAAFGDPSSCSRHRKETHRHFNSYKCPYETCKSKIKRRSAFVAHIKKHGIDPRTFDIEMMASVSLNWSRREIVPAEANFLPVTTWSCEPFNAIHLMGPTQHLYTTMASVPETASQCFENTFENTLYPPPYNDAALQSYHYSISTIGEFSGINSPSSCVSYSPPSLTFSASPSPAPSPPNDTKRSFAQALDDYSYLANMSVLSGTSQACAGPEGLSKWNLDSALFQ